MVLQSKTYFMRARSARKKARHWRAFSYPGGTMRSDGDGGVRAPRPTDKRKAPQRGAIPCRISAKPKQAGQAHRSAPHKIPRKSQGVYLTFTPLPAPQRRGLVRRADERGVSPPVSTEPEGYLGGTASPLELTRASSAAFCGTRSTGCKTAVPTTSRLRGYRRSAAG